MKTWYPPSVQDCALCGAPTHEAMCGNRLLSRKLAQLETDLDAGHPEAVIPTVSPAETFYLALEFQRQYPAEVTRWGKAGTELQAVAWFDNSRQNMHNPDPDAAVRWGEQTSDEMMVGFFDVAVAPDFDKQRFFERSKVQP